MTETPTPQLPPDAPGAAPDLALIKSVVPSVAQVGDQVVYTLALTNIGGAPAVNVTIDDPLPSFLRLIEAQTSSGTAQINGNTVSVSVPVLNPGDGATITIRAEVIALPLPPDNRNVAVARTTDTEITTNNNTSSAILQPPLPDLALIKSVEPTAARVGDQVVYTLVVSNIGVATANDIVLTDELPAFLTLAGVTATAGEVSVAGNQVTVTAAALAPGETITVRVSALVTASPAGANSATVRASNTEITTDNNTSSVELGTLPAQPPTVLPQTAGGPMRPFLTVIGLALIALGLGIALRRRSAR